jgi:hypothetical protein
MKNISSEKASLTMTEWRGQPTVCDPLLGTVNNKVLAIITELGSSANTSDV